ncbi:hypothetical protein PROFUN_05361 [Planoprotostelium fungivorum]|uniref:USP domain-containing protein n=1 Tax=Planoprotostelium fungivorum TaxID=1890364 RepID=A0A2P6NR45_9EUKA|nr:hypothetical protein PROFUN_05361 [Planoprotostelium fungivorum]
MPIFARVSVKQPRDEPDQQNSEGRFRSYDLGVMSPTRFHCATSLDETFDRDAKLYHQLCIIDRHLMESVSHRRTKESIQNPTQDTSRQCPLLLIEIAEGHSQAASSMLGLGSLFEEGDDVESITNVGAANGKTVYRPQRTHMKPRPEHGFVGLANQGATCYLNSLIQCMYMTPELRSGIYQLSQETLGVENKPPPSPTKEKKETQITPPVSQVIEPVTSGLKDMGFDEGVAKRAVKRYPNCENFESLVIWCCEPDASETYDESANMGDSLFDATFWPGGASVSEPTTEDKEEKKEEEKKAEEKKEEEKKEEKEDKTAKKPFLKVPYELQRLFGRLQLADTNQVTTESLTKSFGWTGSEVYDQHDVHELNRLLFDAIERSLQRTTSNHLISDLYRGTLVNKIICQACHRTSAREEHFQDVTLIVKGFPSVEESLKSLVNFELLEGSNQYFCEGCNAKADAMKGVLFRSLPPVIIFSLGRFEYDWTEDKRKKITSPFKYPLVLNMSQYKEEGGKEEGGDLYHLFAVVIHSGGAYGGHYHTYIRSLNEEKSIEEEEGEEKNWKEDLKGQWYDFDDSTVRKISVQKLASQFGGADMLIYRRADMEVSEKSHIPPFLEQELALENETLRMERERLDREDNQISVGIIIPSHVNLSEEKEFQLRENDMTQRAVQLDRRMQVKEALRYILREMNEDASQLTHVSEMSIGGTADSKQLRFLRDIPVEEKSLYDMTITDGSVLFLWNGTDVNGRIWDGQGRECALQLIWSGEQDQERVESLNLRENSQICDLMDLVATTTGIPRDELEMTANGRTSITDKTVGSLLQWNIGHTSVLHAYRKIDGGKMREGNRNPQTKIFTINIQLNIPYMTATTVSIDVDMLSTIDEIKGQVLEKVELVSHKPQALRIGRLHNGQVIQTYEDETKNLYEVFFQVEDQLVLFVAPTVNHHITLRFMLVKDGKSVTGDIKTIDVLKGEAISDVKVNMASIFFKTPEKMRLRRTDMYETAGDIITEEDSTVDSVGLCNDDLLWLEEGRVPVRGEIRVVVQRYHTATLDSMSNPYVSVPLFYHWSSQRLSCDETSSVDIMSTLDVDNNITLFQLRQKICTLRELFNEEPETLRLWKGDKLLNNLSVTLKRAHITENTTITVEVLKKVIVQSEGHLILHIQPRQTKRKAFGRPVVLVVDGNDSLSQLKEKISDISGVKETEELELYRLGRFDGTWQDVDKIEKEDMNKKEEKNEEKKKESNLKGKKLGFRDGDVIVWRDKREDLTGEDKYYEKTVVKTASVDRRARWSHKDDDVTYQRPKPREAVLSIHLDF